MIRAAASPALAAVQQETLSAIHADLHQALTAAATARHRGPAADSAVEAWLLLAVVDGLMFDAVSAPGTLTPADLEAALDTYLDRLLPANDHPTAT
jgi:hypothetical protein